MSHVTNVILLSTRYLGDWEQDRLSLVNEHLLSQGFGKLVSVEDEKFPQKDAQGQIIRWYGGSKVFAGHCAIGAFNHLDIEKFLALLRDEMPWGNDDGTCQVVLKDEHDTRFSLHDIFIGAW